ncbi:MAG TPA: hypothetical protein DCQ14_05985 [Firmicutes bacterium]|nr:hypothetical protein [Bacillota bacterium]
MEQILGPLVEYINAALMFFFYQTGNYGLAIILLAFVVNLLTFPLTKKQISASRKLQELQPELKKLQEKYKGDKEKYNRAMMEYMREHRVNPLGGCLPLLIQLPIIFAVFQLLNNPGATVVDNTFFLGLDLLRSASEAAPDFGFINPYYILPLISAAATFFHQRLVLTDPKQKMLLYIFPVMILVFSVSFPAGLVLYWTTNSLFSIGNHFVIKALDKDRGRREEKGTAKAGKEVKTGERESSEARKDWQGGEIAVADKVKRKADQDRSKKKNEVAGKKEASIKIAPKSKKKVKGKKKGAGRNR